MATGQCSFERPKGLNVDTLVVLDVIATTKETCGKEKATTRNLILLYGYTGSCKNVMFCVNTTIYEIINYKPSLTSHCCISKPILGAPVIADKSCTAFCCCHCQTIKVTFLRFLLIEGAERKLNLLGLCCKTQQIEHLCTNDSYIVGNRIFRTSPAVTSVPNFSSS